MCFISFLGLLLCHCWFMDVQGHTWCVCFSIVISFLGSDRKPKHVTFGLFEAIDITKQALARNLIDLLDIYGLKNKIITLCQRWRFNLEHIDNYIQIYCEMWTFKLEGELVRDLFWACFPKAYQYTTIDEKIKVVSNLFM